MPRAIRCNLPNQPYECSTRTVNEQFFLNPFAAPGRLAAKYDNTSPNDKKRLERDAQIAEKNSARLSELIQKLNAWRQGNADEPIVTVDTLPETVNNIVGTWLAKAIEHTKVDFYGFVVLDNHPHHLLSHQEGKLEAFFQYFDGQVARALNRFHGRHHQLWSRRYSAIPVLDETADIQRLLYILTNPQKADLVDTIGEWPGLSSAKFYLQGDDTTDNEFLFFDRTAWHYAKKPKNIARFLQVVRIKYTVLPALANMAELKRQELISRLIGERESELRTKRQSESKSVLGKGGLMKTDTKARPANPKRSRMPLCLCSDAELTLLFITARYYYEAVYRDLTRAYREADRVYELELPLGAYPPPKLLRYRHPADPERSPLPNLTVRG
jgi:hypothetical protein